MVITFQVIQRQQDGSWLFQWEGTADLWRIVLNGKEISTVTEPEYIFSLPGYEETPPPLEIVASSSLALSERNTPFIVLQWHGVECACYEVKQLVNESWVTRKNINEAGKEIYSYQTSVLTDCAESNFKIVPVNSYEYEGEALEFSAYIVRPPDEPETIQVSYEDEILTIE
jgi:hypothetical protein